MNATWTKVSAGHYRTADGQFEAIKESDSTGWSLYQGSRRAAFVGTYKQCREEVASHADATPTTPKVRKPGLTSVTHTDGTISTRRSKTNTYTYALEIAPAPADAYAAYLIRQAEKDEAKAAALLAAAANGKGHIKDRHLGRVDPDALYTHQATLDGTNGEVYTWCSRHQMTQDHSDVKSGQEAPVVKVLGYLIRSAREMAQYHIEQAAKLRAEAVEVLAAGQPVGEYGVLRWSSRADLAGKALGEFDTYTHRGHALRVVPVD